MGNTSSVVAGPATASTSASEKSACPVLSDAEVHHVYNELKKGTQTNTTQKTDVLNEKNAMPVGLRNKPMEGQLKPLSVERVQSTIPKGGTADTWTYPSPQMFFNALKRKGKGEDIVEDDMQSVVQAHNVLNEVTWRHLLKWEKLHCQECPEPKLMKFCGRPDTLSPKARFYSIFRDGPFDRHDWVVDRCGKPVRYVIDFYFDERKAGRHEAFIVDARPALDSLESVHDRVKMSIYRMCTRFGLPCPITGHSTSVETKAIQERVQT